jgi:ribonuclease R
LAKSRKKTTPFPSREEILAYITENPGRVGTREIARAFHLGSNRKADINQILRELKEAGLIEGGRGRRASRSGTLPPVGVVEIIGTDADGEVLARTVNWREKAEPPTIYMAPERRGRPALGTGERALARLTRGADGDYQGRTIRRLTAAPRTVLGVYRKAEGQGRLLPINRRDRKEYVIAGADDGGARPGELVEAEVLAGRAYGLGAARVVERLGTDSGPRSISMITIHDHRIPHVFPPPALAQAEAAGPAPEAGREDLRPLPLVTIDGEDARDFDDAVWAEADAEPGNPGGWQLIVAIADVAWYVRPGDALDEEARARGNSVYFPDRVVPMLPEPLSNGWCSLKLGEDRPCQFVRMWIDAAGRLLRHRFGRGIMHSAARLTYAQAQAARDGAPDAVTAPLTDSVITPLFDAYRSLARGRVKRGVLELDLPERHVVLDDGGDVSAVELRARHDSHRLIEEFMITANVAAAETLEKLKHPCMYRVHDVPTVEKLDALRTFLGSIGLKLAKGQVIKPSHLNHILEQAADTPHAHIVNQIVLRSQSQAQYTPHNIGHFGLALRRYAHFTSPIRRYADLLVHRALIDGLGMGAGGMEDADRDFSALGEALCMTERRAQVAERDAVDRYTASYLAERVGARFTGRISGVSRFGLFVTLDESGGDGLVPVRTLPRDTYTHDEAHHALRGTRSGRSYGLGEAVEVRLAEATPLTGGLILHLLDEGAGPGRRSRGGKVRKTSKRKGPPRRKRKR